MLIRINSLISLSEIFFSQLYVERHRFYYMIIKFKIQNSLKYCKYFLKIQ